MKKCPICGIENEEQFTFCSQCGEKLDDKIHCPSCNELIQKNSVFCGFCGAKIKNKKNCPYCNEENPYDANFCSFCGKEIVKSKVKQDRNTEKNKEILNFVAKIVYIVLCFLCIVSVFLPVYKAIISNNFISIESDVSIFDFLKSEYWSNVYLYDEYYGTGWSSNYIISTNSRIIIPGVVTIIGALAAIAFSIIGIVKNSIVINDKKQNPNHKFGIIGIGLYFVYVFTTVFTCDGLYSTLIGGQRNKYTLSAMPIIMLILCLGSLITFKVLELCFENKKRNVNEWVSFGLKMGAFVFLFVAMFLICGPIIKQYGQVLPYSFSNVSLLSEKHENLSAILWIIIMCGMVGLIVDYVSTMFNCLFDSDKKTSNKNLINIICFGAGVILLFILSRIYLNPVFSYSLYKGSVKFSTSMILSLVFSLAGVGLVITTYFINKKR